MRVLMSSRVAIFIKTYNIVAGDKAQLSEDIIDEVWAVMRCSEFDISERVGRILMTTLFCGRTNFPPQRLDLSFEPVVMYKSPHVLYQDLEYPTDAETMRLCSIGTIVNVCGWDLDVNENESKLLVFLRAPRSREQWPVWVDWWHIPCVGRGTKIEARARFVVNNWSTDFAMDDSACSPSLVLPFAVRSRLTVSVFL